MFYLCSVNAVAHYVSSGVLMSLKVGNILPCGMRRSWPCLWGKKLPGRHRRDECRCQCTRRVGSPRKEKFKWLIGTVHKHVSFGQIRKSLTVEIFFYFLLKAFQNAYFIKHYLDITMTEKHPCCSPWVVLEWQWRCRWRNRNQKLQIFWHDADRRTNWWQCRTETKWTICTSLGCIWKDS